MKTIQIVIAGPPQSGKTRLMVRIVDALIKLGVKDITVMDDPESIPDTFIGVKEVSDVAISIGTINESMEPFDG